MNVLFITPDFYPNSTGFANASTNLVNSILKYGEDNYKVFVFTEVQLGSKQELNGISVYRYKFTGPKRHIFRILYERKRYKSLCGYIEKNNIDIIFFETNTFPFLENWVLDRYGKKVFVRIHSTADTEVPIFGEKRTIGARIAFKKMKDFMAKVANIVSTSNYYLDFIKRFYLDSNVYTMLENKSYGIIYNTSVDGILPKSVITNNIFITMGKMSKSGVIQKGITDLLKSVFYLAKNNKIHDDFNLIIIGDGEEYSRILSTIHKLNLEKYIQLVRSASHDEVFEYISQAKATILVSRYEGQSMFVTESLSLGKPLLLTIDNGMSDMIVDGGNGFLARTGDPVDIASAISKIMALGKDELDAMGNKSRLIYETKFSLQSAFEQFDCLMKLSNLND